MAATEGDDRVCAGDGPEHAGLFEAGTDHGFATGFDDAGADEQVLAAKLRIAHALGISLEVVGLGTNLLGEFGVG